MNYLQVPFSFTCLLNRGKYAASTVAKKSMSERFLLTGRWRDAYASYSHFKYHQISLVRGHNDRIWAASSALLPLPESAAREATPEAARRAARGHGHGQTSSPLGPVSGDLVVQVLALPQLVDDLKGKNTIHYMITDSRAKNTSRVNKFQSHSH